MKDKLLKQAEREYELTKRLHALTIGATIFLGVLPFALISLSSMLDSCFLLPTFYY